jgi:16S rRNA (uracil1498-N3)-methyltransferase
MPKHIPRVYLLKPLKEDEEINLSDDEAHHLLKVLHVKIGHIIKLFNEEDGEWSAKVMSLGRKEVNVRLQKRERAPVSSSHKVTLYVSPLKQGRTELVIEKATELGVSDIQPIICAFSQVPSINEDRWAKKLIEASEQCERLDIPTLHPLMTFADLMKKEEAIYYGCARAQTSSLIDLLQNEKPNKFGILVGPEGGFSEREEILLSEKATGFSLSQNVLRSETAGIAAMAVVSCWLI